MRLLAHLALLVLLWLLAWGEASLANLVSGFVVAGVLLVAFPPGRMSHPRSRFSVTGWARLALHLLVQLVISNVLVTREILSRRSRMRTGVLAYHVERPSDLVLTLIANIVALSPGTMTVEVTRDPAVIYVHFLLLRDVDEARRAVARLEALVVAAIGGGARRPQVAGVQPEELP